MNSIHTIERPAGDYCWARGQYQQRAHLFTRTAYDNAQALGGPRGTRWKYMITGCAYYATFYTDATYPLTDYQNVPARRPRWRTNAQVQGRCLRCESVFRRMVRQGLLRP